MGTAGALAGSFVPKDVRASRQRASDQVTRAGASGPLRVHQENPRYFSDAAGKPVYLTGSHMWNNLVDMGPQDPPKQLNFGEYLGFLERHGHNFIRLWTWEHTSWDTTANGRWGKDAPHYVTPHPWRRTGPGQGLDGKPKFDLDSFNPEYFDRLRARVAAAGERNIYVSVMLFEGWAMQHMKDAWSSHPLHPRNNLNKTEGDADGDGRGLEIHTLVQPKITGRQEAYVKKVIDTVNDLDNVLYEISNENHPASTEWQYHMIRLIHNYEQNKAKQHPVGMTFQYRGGSNKTLFEGPADWVSPNADGGYRDNPPAADGSKVILTDTDHLWGIGGNAGWAWKSFLRGLNPLFMDPYDGVVLGDDSDPNWKSIRRSLGQTRQWAQRLNLARCLPRTKLASTRYCLADAGREYLVYLPQGGRVTVDLTDAEGSLKVEWFDPSHETTKRDGRVNGGNSHEFTSPFQHQALLYLHG
jgi:hypothetical protein